MGKSLLRAFIFSLIIFLGLNFLLYIIGYSIGGILDLLLTRITDHPTHTIYLFIYPSQFLPWDIIGRGINTASIAFKIIYFGGFITLVIAAIVAGFLGGSIGKSFGGWILTVICSMILFIVIFIIDDYNLTFISFSTTLLDGIGTILITGLVNILIFGGLVTVIALIKGSD